MRNSVSRKRQPLIHLARFYPDSPLAPRLAPHSAPHHIFSSSALQQQPTGLNLDLSIMVARYMQLRKCTTLCIPLCRTNMETLTLHPALLCIADGTFPRDLRHTIPVHSYCNKDTMAISRHRCCMLNSIVPAMEMFASIAPMISSLPREL